MIMNSESAERPTAERSDVPLVVLDLVLNEELYEFVSKRNLAAAVRFADSLFIMTRGPGVRCAHPGLYAFVRYADFFRASMV